MSMLEAFLNKGGFKAAKCKTLLKLTIPRIKLLRNRREIQLKQMRRDIAKLLANGQEATARIRVEHIIREENMMAAQEIIELFCELIAVRLPIIETQRECPLDLKEAISSVCFAAPRCSDLPELQQVQMMFAGKYGKEFVAAATELLPDCGVNRQIIELLSIRAPSVEAKLKLLKEIAEEHEVDWDPAASESEYLKPHEDLLNGPGHIISGSSSLPLPKTKHEDSLSSEHTEKLYEEADSDAGFDSFDLPEVPKSSVRAALDIPSTDSEPIKPKPSENADGEFHNSETSATVKESKPFQFVPFVAVPPPPPFELPTEPTNTTLPFVAAPPPPPFELPTEPVDTTPNLTPGYFESHSEPRNTTPLLIPDSPPHVMLHPQQSDPNPVHSHDSTRSISPTKTEPNIDLQDVLAAAQAAADSADRAAAAARAAASLAQVRITELVAKRNGSGEKTVPAEAHEETAAKRTYDKQDSFQNYEPEAESRAHQPQRSVSMEDDPYFSYPNLFSRQDSGVKPVSRSSDEHLR